MLIKDSELNTVEEITMRLNSIEKQREELCSSGTRHGSLAFEKKQNKIRKLTQRHDALWVKRANLLKIKNI